MAIRRLARIPAAAFDASYAQHPVVVQGIMDEWPAMKWTLEELESRSIKTLVPIEVSATDPTANANATAPVDMINAIVPVDKKFCIISRCWGTT